MLATVTIQFIVLFFFFCPLLTCGVPAQWCCAWLARPFAHLAGSVVYLNSALELTAGHALVSITPNCCLL